MAGCVTRCIGLWLLLGPVVLNPQGAAAMPTTPKAQHTDPAGSRVEVGVGGPGDSKAPGLPRTLAQAAADHAETVRKCRLLTVAAVRDECLREAQRTLEREQARLKAPQEGGR